MKSYSSSEVIKLLEEDGWFLKGPPKGSHYHYVHPKKKGKVTVPHPRKDLGKGLLKAIEKQSGVTLT